MLDLQLLDDPLPVALDWITQEARGTGGAQVMAELIRALARDDQPLFAFKGLRGFDMERAELAHSLIFARARSWYDNAAWTDAVRALDQP